eukprot:2942382-Rhodomonas_salina.1
MGGRPDRRVLCRWPWRARPRPSPPRPRPPGFRSAPRPARTPTPAKEETSQRFPTRTRGTNERIDARERGREREREREGGREGERERDRTRDRNRHDLHVGDRADQLRLLQRLRQHQVLILLDRHWRAASARRRHQRVQDVQHVDARRAELRSPGRRAALEDGEKRGDDGLRCVLPTELGVRSEGGQESVEHAAAEGWCCLVSASFAHVGGLFVSVFEHGDFVGKVSDDEIAIHKTQQQKLWKTV